MSAAAGVAKESANAVGPMTSGDYAFKRNEVKRRKELKSLSKKTYVPKIQLVNAFVTQVTPTPSQSKRVIPKRKVNLSLENTSHPCHSMAKYMEWENFSVSLESIVREVMHVVQ